MNFFSCVAFFLFSCILLAEQDDPQQTALRWLRSTLQESIYYNESLLHSLQRLQESKSVEETIPEFKSLQQKGMLAMQKGEELKCYLKAHGLEAEQLQNFQLIMSQYRLQSLIQMDQLMREVYRLNENAWYGTTKELKEKVGYIAYVRHNFRNETIQHQDTKDRIEEYRIKTENLSNEFLDQLSQITSSETAKQYALRLPVLLKKLQNANDVINLYLYDDFDGGKQLLPGMMKRFYDLNGCLLDEVERIKKNDYYHDSALKEFILSLGFPILHLLAEPVERTDRISLPE